MDRRPFVREELENELHTALVPGTEVMTDVGSHHFLKSERNSTVLVPQPSASLNDPLNWAGYWKFSTITAVLLATFAQTFGPLAIAPIFPQLIRDFRTDLPGVAQFTGITILVLGFSNFAWVPLSATFGRRFVLLLSTVISIASMIWRAKATTYSSFMGAAVLAGIGTGPGETIPPAVIADVIFLHDRGFYNTLYFATFFAAVMLGPIIAGTMADGVGWRSFWWLNVALHLFTLIVLLLALPETKWDRDETSSSLETGTQRTGLREDKDIAATFTNAFEENKSAGDQPVAGMGSNTEQQAMLLSKGKPSRGQWMVFQTSKSPFRTLFQTFCVPWKLLTFPIVVFASFIVGFSGSCYLMITFVQSQALGAPPYNFSPQSVGFMNFASLVGALIGLATAGSLSDRVSAKLTERNHGIREPEMRLLAMIPYVLVMILGNFIAGFGFESSWDWRAIAIIGFGCAGVQVAALPAIASTYAVDSYKPAAGSIFVVVTINKNIWGYGVSKFTNVWVEQSGYVPPFMTNMGLLVLWCCFGVIFWIWGKKFRAWTANSSVHRL